MFSLSSVLTSVGQSVVLSVLGEYFVRFPFVLCCTSFAFVIQLTHLHASPGLLSQDLSDVSLDLWRGCVFVYRLVLGTLARLSWPALSSSEVIAVLSTALWRCWTYLAAWLPLLARLLSISNRIRRLSRSPTVVGPIWLPARLSWLALSRSQVTLDISLDALCYQLYTLLRGPPSTVFRLLFAAQLGHRFHLSVLSPVSGRLGGFALGYN